MSIRHINKGDDFDFILKLFTLNADGEKSAVGWPTYDWSAVLRTSGYASYPFSCKGGVAVNCYNDNGQIHVVVDNHSLPVGLLTVEFTAEIPDEIYPDGSRRTVTPEATEIELWNKASDDASEMEISYVLPYIKGDKGDKGEQGERGEQGAQGEQGKAFTYEDFTDEQLSDLIDAVAAKSEPTISATISALEATNTQAQQAEAERASEFSVLSDKSVAATSTANNAADYATAQGGYAKQQGELIDSTLSGISTILDSINGEG
jgi:hypothetical protein